MSLKKLPEISEAVKNRFVNAVRKHHGGSKWRVLKQELEKALIYYIEQGPLADEYIFEDETTADVEKIKLTIPNFFKLFDNEHVYVYDRLDAEYLKGIISKITGKDSNYNWRKWSKIIKESGRIRQIQGTRYYLVNRSNFEFIETDLKQSYDEAIKRRQLESHNTKNTIEDNVWRIYSKLIPGQTTSLTEICQIGGIPEKEGKNVINKLVFECKLQLVARGRWDVLDLAAAKELKEKSLFRVGD